MDRADTNRIEKHLPALDGLRGLAVLLVVFSHNFYYLVLPVIGWIGVDLFFVLSGFLITRILLDSKKEKHFFKHFYMRRILRIFPLYYLVIALMFLYEMFVALPADFAFSNYLFYYISYTQNLLFFIGKTAAEPHLILGHFWSLSVEEQFYLLWPVLVFVCNPKQLIFASAVIICLSKIVSFLLLYYNYSWLAVYSFTFSRFESLAVGGILATLMYVKWRWLYRSASYILILTALLLFVVYSYHMFYDGWVTLSPTFAAENYYSWLFTIISFFFASLLFHVVTNRVLIKFFSIRWLVFTGKYSYGIYIFHYPLFVFITHWLIPHVSTNLYIDLPKKILVSLVCIATTFLLAFISYELMEKRFLKMKRHFPMQATG